MKYQNIINNKFFWVCILFLACVLFILGLLTNNIVFNIVSIILSIVIFSKGDSILFEEYNNNKKKEKIELKKLSKNHLYK